jgi:hypothetical protein
VLDGALPHLAHLDQACCHGHACRLCAGPAEAPPDGLAAAEVEPGAPMAPPGRCRGGGTHNRRTRQGLLDMDKPHRHMSSALANPTTCMWCRRQGVR